MLRIELLGDGGIRIEPPTGAGGLASVRMARAWIGEAADHRRQVEITGETDSPMHAELLSDARTRRVELTVVTTAPAPWNDGWTSLQIAANSGLTEQVSDLLARGASTTHRGPHSPYRLAMHHGYVDTLAALRDGGLLRHTGLRPPDSLPNAVVLRNYLPRFVRWVAITGAVVGVGLALALDQWPFLIVAVVGVAAIAVGNLVVGLTRIAVDGRLLAVRQIARWQGPIDTGDLVAIGYAPAVSRRMSGRWRFVQPDAGPPYRRTAYQGFEQPLADRLKQRRDLRVVTVYCGRGFLSPGLQRHLAPHVQASAALVSSTAQQVFDRVTSNGRP